MWGGIVFYGVALTLALMLFGVPWTSAQQVQESPGMQQARKNAISLGHNRALEGCYSATSDLGAELQKAQERVLQLEGQVKESMKSLDEERAKHKAAEVKSE